MCFHALFMCFSWFVAIPVPFNDLCCWTQCCGSLSRTQLRLMDQSWQTSPNESVLHFEIVFVVCWHQIEKLAQVVYITFLFVLLKLQNFIVLSSNMDDIETNLANAKHTFHVFIWHFKEIVGKVCFDPSFMCLFRFVAFRIAFNNLCCWMQRCGLLSRILLRAWNQIWHTSPNESLFILEVVFGACWH